MIIIDTGNYLSELVMVNEYISHIDKFIHFLFAIVNLIIFKNQVVFKSTNFKEQWDHMPQKITIFQSLFILNLFPLRIEIFGIRFDATEKINKKYLYHKWKDLSLKHRIKALFFRALPQELHCTITQLSEPFSVTTKAKFLKEPFIKITKLRMLKWIHKNCYYNLA